MISIAIWLWQILYSTIQYQPVWALHILCKGLQTSVSSECLPSNHCTFFKLSGHMLCLTIQVTIVCKCVWRECLQASKTGKSVNCQKMSVQLNLSADCTRQGEVVSFIRFRKYVLGNCFSRIEFVKHRSSSDARTFDFAVHVLSSCCSCSRFLWIDYSVMTVGPSC